MADTPLPGSAPAPSRTVLYGAFGLTIASEIPLPEFAEGSGRPDVTVQVGATPERLESPTGSGVLFEARPQEYLLNLPSVARFWVRDGKQVVVQPCRDTRPGYLRTLLMGTVMTAVIHQRGGLMLHASGVAGRRGAVLIAAHSGIGKSTIAGALAKRGYAILCDDAAAVSLKGGQAIVHPGIRQISLWRDASLRLGLELSELSPAHPDGEKVLLKEATFEAQAQPVAAIVFLTKTHESQSIALSPIGSADCVTALRHYTRNLRVMHALKANAAHFRMTAEIASRVPAHRLARPAGTDSLGAVADAIEPLLN